MNADKYYNTIKDQSILVFNKSIEDLDTLGMVTDIKSNLKVWHTLTHQWQSSEMLNNALEELDISCIHLLFGFHRSSFKSLRLALEMICGALYYSAFNLEYTEWEQGSKDLVWSNIVCRDNGIFSPRFSNAYFKELNNELIGFQDITKNLYRELSEMVHGNNSTWNSENPKIELKPDLKKKYQAYIEIMSKILNFGFSLKYLKKFNDGEKEQIETYISASIGHINNIRKELGGPTDE